MSRKKTSWKQRKKDLADMSLEEQYKVLAMRADKRLQRLEKYMKLPGYETLSKGAYARAMRDIKVWSGKGHKRFLTKAPGNVEELQAKINDIKTFLRADTSTLKPGMNTIGYSVSSYEKMAKTFNDRYGGDLDWQEIANYYDSAKADRIAKMIKSSKSIAKALGVFKKLANAGETNKTLMDKIRAGGKERVLINKRHYWRYKNITLTDDEVVNDIMNKMIKNGINPATMFKGK